MYTTNTADMALIRESLILLLAVYFMSFQGIAGQSTSPPNVDQEHMDRMRLVDNLLRQYHPLVIPRTPVPTTYRLELVQIDGVDEKENIVRVSVFDETQWEDHRFQWDPSDFSGISSIRIPADKIWKPDLRPQAQVLEAEDVNVLIHNDGKVSHFQPLRLAIPCSFTFQNYPYDSQTCVLRVESWTNDISKINLTLPQQSPGLGSSFFNAHTLWELQSVKATRNVTRYPCCVEEYGHLEFTFKIKRRLTEYTVRVLAPSVFTSLLILVTFLIPPSCAERTVLCSVLLLGVLMQLFQLNSTVPLTGSDAPFLADFLCFSVFLAFFATVESVVVYILSRGFWGDEGRDKQDGGGDCTGVQVKPNTAMGRIARIADIGCFILFTILFAIVGGVILNPE